jgi:hypothetical protein
MDKISNHENVPQIGERTLTGVLSTLARLNALFRYAHIIPCIFVEGELFQIEQVTILNEEYLRYTCKPRDNIGVILDRHWTEPIYIYLGDYHE